MTTSIVVVNHNGGDAAVENLRRLLGEAASLAAEVVVVDSASVDGSPDRIRDALPQIRLFVEPVNRGYAAGVNRGLREARGSVFVIANADVSARPGALERLVGTARERREFGLLGGLMVGSDGRPSPNCVRLLPGVADIVREGLFQRPRTSTDPKTLLARRGVVETPVVSGAVLALRRETLEAIGPMDEDFFLYREDVDWCRRAASAGLKVGVVADAVFDHAGGASTRAAEGPAFAARIISDFRYFVTIGGARASTIRSLWLLRLAVSSFVYSLDTTLGILGRRASSRKRAAIYRILADRLRSFRWSQADGKQDCHPSRLVDLPFQAPPRTVDPRPVVLLVIPDMGYGGAQRRIEYLVTGPLSREFRFEILCLRSAGAIGQRVRGRTDVYAVGVQSWLSPATWRRIRDYTILLSPDLVQSATFPADVAAFVGFAGRVPRMSIKVSVDAWMTPWVRLVELIALRGCRMITTTGDQVALAKSYLGRDGMLPLAIPNPAMIEISPDPPRPLPVDGPIRLAVLGRLEPVKRVESFLAMASLLERSSPGKFSYHVLGEGSGWSSLQAVARRLKLADRVEFAGGVDDVAAALDRMDIVLLFSEGEGNPNSVVETMARGRVPIVRYAGGAIDSLPRELSDCYVHSASPAAFAEKVFEVVRASEDVLARVHAAKAHIRDRQRFFDLAMRWAYLRALGRGVRTDKVRVLHVITRLIVGGAQENTIASVEKVDPGRFESRLWVGPEVGSEGSLFADARAKGIIVRVLKNLVREVSPIKDILVTLELKRLLSRDRFDILHTHTSKAGVVGRVAARFARVPHVIHTGHLWGFHERTKPVLRRVYVAIERWLINWTDVRVSVSERSTRVGLDHGIGEPGVYRLIRSGIPLGRFHPDPARGAATRRCLGLPADGVVIGTVGRLSPQKNPLDFVRVAARLSERFPGLTFLYVGDGPLRDAVTQAAREDGVADRIMLVGLRDDVPDLLRAMDVFILTSLWEGLPRAILQALATGVPVVAYDVAGIQEAVIEGENGHLVSAGAVDAMVEKITALVQDGARRSEMSRRAVDGFDAGFSEDAMIADLESLYSERVWGRPG